MDELLEQFVIEAAELVQQAADDLLALEREPASRQHIESLFRAVHTLKGSVGLFDFAPLQRTLFSAEDVLTAANRAGELDAGMIDPLIAIIEWTDRCVRDVAGSGRLADDALLQGAALSAALAGMLESSSVAAEPSLVPEWAARLFEAHPEGVTAIRYIPRADCFFSGDDPVALISSVAQVLSVEIGTVEPWPALAELDPFRSNLTFEVVSAASREEIEPRFRLLPDQATIIGRSDATQVIAPHIANNVELRRTMRVDVERVDALVDIVGELFVAKNAMSALVHDARQINGGLALARAIAAQQEEFDRLSTRLQHAATGVRMVPLNETLRRLPRLAREVSAQLGRPVDLEVEGGAIEADKAVVDALFDPLLHVLRNAVDHGIEPAAIRQSRGKPRRGQVTVRARQLGYRIEVSVTDDGGGVDIAAVRAAAVQKGIVSVEQAAGLDDAGVVELLFRSGFSTATTVSDVSGRGVGMDAVRRDVQKLGGRVSIESRAAEGTTVRLSLPISFAVTRIMIVDAAGDRFALPMDAITETLRVDADAINSVRAGEAMILRDRTVPVVRLARLLGLPQVARAEELLLIAEVSGAPIGLVVDRIGERLETILRPATGILKAVNGISGTTVLGDGVVVMVLDLEALIE